MASPTPRSKVSMESRAPRSMIFTLRRMEASSSMAASSLWFSSPARPRAGGAVDPQHVPHGAAAHPHVGCEHLDARASKVAPFLDLFLVSFRTPMTTTDRVTIPPCARPSSRAR